MTVSVHGKNMQVPNEMRDFAIERVEHAARYFDNGNDVDVEFSANQNPRRAEGKYRVEITTNAAGRIVRVEAEAGDERTAVDIASDRYERQLRKLKTKLIQRNRISNKDLNQVSSQSDDEEDRGVEIVRTKRFSMKPMAAEEAVLQMEMLGHEFFFFLDADTDRHCVVYRRRDGNVGLIEPE
ncbi:MAG: ribosome-associated translation inhibitor RaiA [Actinomycetota bacterium]